MCLFVSTVGQPGAELQHNVSQPRVTALAADDKQFIIIISSGDHFYFYLIFVSLYSFLLNITYLNPVAVDADELRERERHVRATERARPGGRRRRLRGAAAARLALRAAHARHARQHTRHRAHRYVHRTPKHARARYMSAALSHSKIPYDIMQLFDNKYVFFLIYDYLVCLPFCRKDSVKISLPKRILATFLYQCNIWNDFSTHIFIWSDFYLAKYY